MNPIATTTHNSQDCTVLTGLPLSDSGRGYGKGYVITQGATTVARWHGDGVGGEECLGSGASS